ncbi:hypothetical protein HK103_005606 [Boothiomyces macroporosus]|uniref:HNH nuclease domain-containing protein n=1 Tax=Boothiomyces macroporosus TaxID=261099 RepID=A0AAD5UJ79_9FUNG|nr:hypothetical protein HK103_005606 [Boothiomyces macroporosus]
MQQANEKLQNLEKGFSTYKILNAMLNATADSDYESFASTRQVIIQDILASDNLEELASKYDNLFLMPMRASGGRPGSRPSSATQRIQEEEDKSHSSSSKSNKFKSDVRERDKVCVLTGEEDKVTERISRGFEVAHIIPQSLLDSKSDGEERKQGKYVIRSFIFRMCPWLPPNFFENLDVCENAILLNQEAHRFFGAFEWFIVMEKDSNNNTIYKAMQVEEDGLLGKITTGRIVVKRAIIDNIETDIPITVSSYNQPLFIGNTHPQPSEVYVRLHELLSRIFYMRGQANYYEQEYDSDDEFQVNQAYLSEYKDESKPEVKREDSAVTFGPNLLV